MSYFNVRCAMSGSRVLSVLVVAVSFGLPGASAQEPKKSDPIPKKDASGGATKFLGIDTNPFGNLLDFGDLKKAAEDFKKAAEALKELAPVAKEITAQLGRDAVKSSENIAQIGKEFDPLGLKTAFATVREQNQTIEKLLTAEAARHKMEAEALRKEVDSLRRQNASLAVQATKDGKQLIDIRMINVLISTGDARHDEEDMHIPVNPPKAGQKEFQIPGGGTVLSVFMIPMTPGDDLFSIVNAGPTQGKPGHVNVSAVPIKSGVRQFKVVALVALTAPAEKK